MKRIRLHMLDSIAFTLCREVVGGLYPTTIVAENVDCPKCLKELANLARDRISPSIRRARCWAGCGGRNRALLASPDRQHWTCDACGVTVDNDGAAVRRT